MKFTILGFSQEKMLEFGMDVKDALILRWIVDFYATNRMRKEIIQGKEYFWINYKMFLKDLPILLISKDMLYRRLKNLCKKNIMEHHTIKNIDGIFSYYRFGELYLHLIKRISHEDEICKDDKNLMQTGSEYIPIGTEIIPYHSGNNLIRDTEYIPEQNNQSIIYNQSTNNNNNKKKNVIMEDKIENEFNYEGFSEEEKEAINDWLIYKKEKGKFTYKKIGLKYLRKRCLELKESNLLIELIGYSISNLYTGIIDPHQYKFKYFKDKNLDVRDALHSQKMTPEQEAKMNQIPLIEEDALLKNYKEYKLLIKGEGNTNIHQK